MGILLLAGCAGGGKLQRASQGPIGARVFPIGPPTWTYEVVSTGVAPITNLGFLTKSDLRKCTFWLEPDGRELPATYSDRGLTVKLPEFTLRQLRFSIRCKEAAQGQIHLQVIDNAGIAHIVGPLAGPSHSMNSTP